MWEITPKTDASSWPARNLELQDNAMVYNSFFFIDNLGKRFKYPLGRWVRKVVCRSAYRIATAKILALYPSGHLLGPQDMGGQERACYSGGLFMFLIGYPTTIFFGLSTDANMFVS